MQADAEAIRRIVVATQRSTREGRPARLTLEALMMQNADDRAGTLSFDAFNRCLSLLAPGIPPAVSRRLFNAHAIQQPGVPPQRSVDARIFAAALFPSPQTAAPSALIPTAPPLQMPKPSPKQAWEVAAPAPAAPASAARPSPRPAAAAAGADAFEICKKDLRWALGCEVASARSAGALPRSERLTMHARQAEATEAQLALLRLLRAVEPRASTVSEAALLDTLRRLRRHFAGAHASAVQILEPAFVSAAWQRSGGGNVAQLLELLCPVPVATGSAAAKPPTFGPRDPVPSTAAGRAAIGVGAALACGSGAGGAGGAGAGVASDARPGIQQGAFDRGDGKPGTKRTGARHVPAPRPNELPQMIKYRQCRTPLLVPDDFDGALVTRSAQRPAAGLRRQSVLGYSGLGIHSRGPNLFTLPDGRLLHSTAAMAVMTDLGTGTQTVYDGHDCDVTCVALHPSGELVATGQGMSAGGADASIHLWQIGSREQVAIIGKVLDERKNDGVTRRPFYPGALCALAFSPNVCWPALDVSNLSACIPLQCTYSSPPICSCCMGPAASLP